MVPKLTEQSKEDRGGRGRGRGRGSRQGRSMEDPETKHACRQAGANLQGQLPRQGKIDLAFTWV